MNICDTLRAMYEADAAANAASPADAGAAPQTARALLTESAEEPRVESVPMVGMSSPDEPMAEALVSGRDALDRLPLAMDYVPMQSWGETYDGLQALDAGTIFPDLNLPFEGRRLSR